MCNISSDTCVTLPFVPASQLVTLVTRACLKVRVYDNKTAIATYTDTYDGMVRGEHRVKTVLSTDTFVRQNGVWKQVAGHSSVAQ
jgi:hypothetical protein